MTREEAIKRLRVILTEAVETENSVCYVTEEDREPLEMAIKALEREQQKYTRLRHCDCCRVLLTEDNNKCGYELCDECNERLKQEFGKGAGMTDEELRVRAIQELEFYKKDDTFMLADITVDLAIKALEQMPVTTTAGEGGVIYYPQVEGVTPTVIDVGKQEPCEMTAEEYRQRMIQAFHNADTDELIAICVLPTEKEFEHLEWLLKNHYKKEPCGDAIDRAKAIEIASGYCHPANVAKELAKMPPVTPQPKTEQFAEWVATEIFDDMWEYNKDAFDELACRKLAKLGIVRAKGDEWELVEPQERSDKE